jgi:hypothetical protein
MTKSKNIREKLIPWTKEEEDKLKILSKTFIVKKIAEQMNRKIPAIKWKLRALGLSTRGLRGRSLDQKLKIYKYLDKYGYKKTCEHFNLSYRQVSKIKSSYLRKITKIQQVRHPESLEKLRRYAIAFALKRRCSVEDAEDFGIHAVVKQIELGTVGVDVYFLYINWQDDKHLRRKKRDVAYEEGFEFCNKEDFSTNKDREDFLRLIKIIEQPYRTILVLKFLFNFSNEDIAVVLGVTSSMICTHYKNLLADLKVNFKFNRTTLIA